MLPLAKERFENHAPYLLSALHGLGRDDHLPIPFHREDLCAHLELEVR